MDEKGKEQITALIDVIVAVVILIIGFLVILFGISWGDFLSPSMGPSGYGGYNSPIIFFSKTPWIIILIGVCTLIYGIKRLIYDILKMF